MPDACPQAASVPKSAEGTAVRQVQISFHAYAPKGTSKVKVGGKTLQCPTDNRVSQIVRFSMPTSTGSKKTVTLDDGTQLTVTASRK